MEHPKEPRLDPLFAKARSQWDDGIGIFTIDMVDVFDMVNVVGKYDHT